MLRLLMIMIILGNSRFLNIIVNCKRILPALREVTVIVSRIPFFLCVSFTTN